MKVSPALCGSSLNRKFKNYNFMFIKRIFLYFFIIKLFLYEKNVPYFFRIKAKISLLVWEIFCLKIFNNALVIFSTVWSLIFCNVVNQIFAFLFFASISWFYKRLIEKAIRLAFGLVVIFFVGEIGGQNSWGENVVWIRVGQVRLSPTKKNNLLFLDFRDL